jgi:CDP-diacylglycerol pyrophosphatase
LAVNSVYGRSQDQLHIHIDCIKPAVRAALDAHARAIGPNWAPFPVPLAGEPYLAKRIDGSDLAGANPFRLLAALPEARAAMGQESLVVTGETGAGGRPGFILLAGRTRPGFGKQVGRSAAGSSLCTGPIARTASGMARNAIKSPVGVIGQFGPVRISSS